MDATLRTITARRSAIAALLLAGLVTACGGSAAGSPAASRTPAETSAAVTPTEEPSSAASSLLACDVVTQADVAAVLGKDVAPGILRKSSAAGLSDCRYEGTNVVVGIDTLKGDRRFEAAHDTYQEITEVPGLGDGAFYSAAEDAFVFRKGKVSVIMNLFMKPADAQRVGAALAALALARL
jgi:hypothetical protein